MKIPRQELLAALKMAEPALATKPIIDELMQFWFTGEQVVAFNDILGITIPLETEFKGGIKGSLLIGLLEKSRAKEIDITPSENEVVVKAANARLNLAYFDISKSIWTEPEFDNPTTFIITKEFIDAIENVLVSIGYDTSVPDQLGVTLLHDEKNLYFFTTDSKTISRAALEFECNGLPERIILPATFCEQLLKLCRNGGKITLSNDQVCATTKDNIKLFSRLLSSASPLQYQKTVSSALRQLDSHDVIPIPNRFKLAIERISIVLESVIGEPAEFNIADGILHMYAKSEVGEIKDSMKLDEDHMNIKVHIDPALIKRAIDSCDWFCIGESCMFLTKDNFTHLISLSDR